MTKSAAARDRAAEAAPAAAREAVTIARLVELERKGHAGEPIIAGIEAIFFESSGRSFASEPDRLAFRDLWLGQFLERDRDHVFVALAPGGHVAGYLIGCWENPAQSARFAGLTYFRDFEQACHSYPGHLHINLDTAYRNRGIGVRLIDAFAGRASAAGIPGIHVVTGASARNARFYERCGFRRIAATTWNDREVVFLGRSL